MTHLPDHPCGAEAHEPTGNVEDCDCLVCLRGRIGQLNDAVAEMMVPRVFESPAGSVVRRLYRETGSGFVLVAEARGDEPLVDNVPDCLYAKVSPPPGPAGGDCPNCTRKKP